VIRERVFLEEHLAAVGHDVKQAEALKKSSDERNPRDPRHDRAIGTGTILHPGRDLAFGHRADAGDREDHHDHGEAFEEALNERRKVEEKISHDGGRKKVGRDRWAR
jgi:hypothetical protein